MGHPLGSRCDESPENSDLAWHTGCSSTGGEDQVRFGLSAVLLLSMGTSLPAAANAARLIRVLRAGGQDASLLGSAAKSSKVCETVAADPLAGFETGFRH